MVRCKIITYILIYEFFVLKLGNFFFNALFNDQDPFAVPSILILVIGILHYLLPTESLNDFLFPLTSKDEVLDYDQAVNNFDKVLFRTLFSYFR